MAGREIVSPSYPHLRLLKKDNLSPAQLTSEAIRMAGINEFPVPTSLIAQVGEKCFGIETPQPAPIVNALPSVEFVIVGGRFDILDNSPLQSPFNKPEPEVEPTPNERYALAFKLGTELYPEDEDSAHKFARSLLVPQFKAKLEPNFHWWETVQNLAIKAEVPFFAALQTMQDINRKQYLARAVVIGGKMGSSGLYEGFVCSKSGVAINPEGFNTYYEALLTLNVKSVFFATLNKENQKVQLHTSKGGALDINEDLPNGSEHVLLLRLGDKVQEVQRETAMNLIRSQHRNSPQLIIPVDPQLYPKVNANTKVPGV